MGDHNDAAIGAVLQKTRSQGRVVKDAQCDLDRGDVNDVPRLIELLPVDVGHTDSPHHSLAKHPGQSANGSPPRRSLIRCMDEHEVDRKTVERREARFAIREQRAGAAVGYPAATGTRHAALRDDSRGVFRAGAAQRSRQQSFVVSGLGGVEPICVRRVENGDAGCSGSPDRRERKGFIAGLDRREAHAAEADAKFPGIKPSQARRRCHL